MVGLAVLAVAWGMLFLTVPYVLQRSVSTDEHAQHADQPVTATKALLDGTPIPVQVIFAETSPKVVRIDCLLMTALGSRDAGYPFTVKVSRPENAALDAAMVSTLETLAEKLAEVKLRFLISDGEPRVRIATNQSAMTLDLTHGATSVS